jgi:sugar lactone lactonase YvrE
MLSSILISAVLLGQIPPSEPLAPADVKPFHDEVQRIEGLLNTAGDKCTVMYALARTWAAGGEYGEAMGVLEKVAGLKVGLDPSNDQIFAKLRASSEFQTLLRKIRDDTPPVSHSRVAFTLDEADLFPEGIAYDARQKRFFLGSVFRGRVVACAFAGACRTFVKEGQDGLGSVLGLRVDPSNGTLWATSNRENESGLFHYGDSGRLIHKYIVSEGSHLFNDLVVDRGGNVCVTDTRAGTVYQVSHATDRLEVFNPALTVDAANGIAIVEQGRERLYVAGFPDGITVVDVASRSFRALPHPANLCLGTIDGLYYSGGNLFAIQNGIMAHRVVRYRLTHDLDAIDDFEILERRNPLFDGGPTTAAIAEGALYFMANNQLDALDGGKVRADVRLNPIKVLRIDRRH